jgi:Ca2+-binding RTX toxin-like protein
MATIYGTNYADYKYGTFGADVLYLYEGNDYGYGYDGNDTIYGHGGNDNLYGGYGDDSLEGGNGNDYLSGGDGNDTLVGGMDNDVMYGWAGADIFRFTSITDWWGIGDTIGDYHWWEGDKIDLSGVDAKAYSFWSPSTWGDQAFAWKGNSGGATLGKGELGYYQSSGNTYVCGNVDGDSDFEVFITVNGNVPFIASDFYL